MIEWPDLPRTLTSDSGKTLLAAGVTLMAACATTLATWHKDPLGGSQRSRILRDATDTIKFWAEWKSLQDKLGVASESERERISTELRRVSIEVHTSRDPAQALFHTLDEFELYRANLKRFRQFALLYPLPRLNQLPKEFPERTFKETAGLVILRLLRWITSLLHWYLPLLALLETLLSVHLWLNLLLQNDPSTFYREALTLWRLTITVAFFTWLIHLAGRACEKGYLALYPFPRRGTQDPLNVSG